MESVEDITGAVQLEAAKAKVKHVDIASPLRSRNNKGLAIV